MIGRLAHFVMLPPGRRVQLWRLAFRLSFAISAWVSRRYAQATVDAVREMAGQTAFTMSDSFLAAATRRLEDMARR